jgi:hypothetical protein
VDGGEGPSPIQAAAWLDIKRTYMAQRPDLRRVYTTVCAFATYAPVVARLHFQPLEDATVDYDGVTYHSAVLDMGASSVDGWLADLVGEELGLDDDVAVDSDAGELVLRGRRVALTPLELGVAGHLHARDGKVVSRGELLREVWGHEHAGGSNLVDSVVRSLRRKLGPDAACVETVRGYGYRFRRP